MKKIYTVLAFSVSCFSASAQSSFSLQNLNNYLQGNAALYLFEGGVDVVNNSSSSKDVIMVRTINNLATSHESYFCWGSFCYNPGVSISFAETMPAGTSLHAVADLTTGMVTGLSKVTYCWYDANNTGDSLCLEFVYDITTGINEVANANADFLSMPHPNPADMKTTIFYHLKKQDAGSRIVFYNVIGSKILDIKLDDSKQELQVNTASFQPGAYYYSLISGSRTIGTKKLIVSHRN
jgi:hypothetical protein